MKKIIRSEDGKTKVFTVNELPTKTQQQFKIETDVNYIVSKYKNTGIWPASQKIGQYLDVSEVPDYHTAMNTVISAQNAFNALPAQLRNRFRNDPHELLQFLQNPENYDEGVKLGLFEQKQQPQGNKNDLNETHTPQAASKTEPSPQHSPIMAT